jgi:hypothetical protein
VEDSSHSERDSAQRQQAAGGRQAAAGSRLRVATDLGGDGGHRVAAIYVPDLHLGVV